MRIVQLLPELNEGGVERGVVELNRELARRGHESLVISAGGKLAQQIEVEGGKHIMLDVRSKNPLSVPVRTIKLRNLLTALKPDIIHARSRVPAWLSYFANRSLRLPFVTTVHGFNSVNPYSAIMTRGDRVICVSEAIKRYIQRHYRTPDEKIAVIPRGIDLDRFDPQRIDREFMRNFIRNYALEGKRIVTTVGRITQLKDLETFIDAIGILKERFAPIAGVIVGGVRADKEAYFASLKRRVAERGLECEIRFVGSQSRVAEIYALSDVVVSSSKKPESFGRSVAEAIAMNTPVAATGHGGVLEIVREGIDGFFYRPGEAQGLADAVTRAAALRPEGHAYVRERFSLERMVEATLAVYREVCR